MLEAERERALSSFDRHADLAVTFILRYLEERREDLIELARERFIEGFDLYPDGPLFDKSSWELVEEGDQEGADWIVYVARMLDL